MVDKSDSHNIERSLIAYVQMEVGNTRILGAF